MLRAAVQNIDLSISIMEGDLVQTRALKEMILWCLVIGGIAATGRSEEREWFVAELNSVVRELGMSGWLWEDLRVFLRRFLWVDEACGPGGEVLWEEVLAVGEREVVRRSELPVLPLPILPLPRVVTLLRR